MDTGKNTSAHVADNINDAQGLQREEDEKKLRELNEHSELILNSLDEGVAMLDRSGVILRANRHLAEKNRTSMKEIIGMKIEDFMSGMREDFILRRRRELLRVFETGEPVCCIEELNGLWSHSRLYPVLKDGRVSSVVLISSDITDRKRMEDEIGKNAILQKEAELLKLKEQEYLEILDGSSLASWIYEINTKTLRISAEWKKRIGGENVLDADMDSFLAQLIHPDDKERLLNEEKEVFKQKPHKFKRIYRQKTVSEGYVWILDQGNVVYDQNGTAEKIFGTTLDITDQVKADAEIKSVKDDLAAEVAALKTIHEIEAGLIAQNDLNTICREILHAAVSVTSAQKGCIRLYLPEEKTLKAIHAVSFDEALLREYASVPIKGSIWETMPKDKKSIALVNSENRQSFFFTYLASQGILRGQSFPLISGNGEFVGVLNTYYRENKEFNNRESRMLDMLAHIAADAIERISMEKALQQSERHALELVEELKKTDRTKNDFISVLAHELRNPLAALDSGLILLSASRDKSETENAKQIMRRQIDYLRGLVEDLLDMTRIAQNKLKLDKTKIDIGVIAQQAADDIRPQYEAKNVRLTEHIAPTPLYLDADALRMNQILENLLNNSLKFTDQRGSVTLSVFQESGQAVLRVADDGIGIRSEILPNIFDAYTQADQAHMRISGGLGLGLSIVKNITKLHGGTVEAFSEGPGTGAVFTVRLPLDSYDAPESEENAGGKQECASLKILIIEDNQALADIQSILFQHMGYLVETAHDGFEGIRKAITGVPDVILCDIGMPGISGYEVAQTLRMNPVLAQTVFVALTGYASEEEKKKALESGFTMHLSKPVNTAALERVFDEVAAKKRRSKSDD